MKKLLLTSVLAILIGMYNNGLYAQGTKGTNLKEWQLIWQDDFSGKDLDKSKWNVLIRETSKHDELQYYIPEEVSIKDGSLRIQSSKRDYGDKNYTSGRLDTKDKLSITYGRFEIRGKLPVGKGIWPAYWLYPQNRDWGMEYLMKQAVRNGDEKIIPELRPWYTEIDIMEYLGHEPSVFYATFHYTSFKGDAKSSSKKHVANFSFADDYHIFVLEWTPEYIKWFIDGKLIHTATEGIPHTPHFLILNTAVGGTWPGNPDATTKFPQYHDIDYVKVYQRK